MFTVKVSQKNGPEQVLNFSEREVRIGRVSSNEIVLPKSNISKRHALLSHSSGGLAITDTKSTNGTFVNGERINGVCDLSCGDKIYLGEFTVEIIEIEEAQTASENPSRVETKSQPKLDPISSGRDAILSDDWGANGEISDSWTGDWKSQTAQAKPDSAAVDALDMASGFPTIEPSIEEQDIDSGPEVSRKEERNLILSKTDYEKIQRLYKKVLESQDKLSQSLSHYKNKLKALGEVLQDTPVTLEPLKRTGD